MKKKSQSSWMTSPEFAFFALGMTTSFATLWVMYRFWLRPVLKGTL